MKILTVVKLLVPDAGVVVASNCFFWSSIKPPASLTNTVKPGIQCILV